MFASLRLGHCSWRVSQNWNYAGKTLLQMYDFSFSFIFNHKKMVMATFNFLWQSKTTINCSCISTLNSLYEKLLVLRVWWSWRTSSTFHANVEILHWCVVDRFITHFFNFFLRHVNPSFNPVGPSLLLSFSCFINLFWISRCIAFLRPNADQTSSLDPTGRGATRRR